MMFPNFGGMTMRTTRKYIDLHDGSYVILRMKGAWVFEISTLLT
jgi:hypothetical protein